MSPGSGLGDSGDGQEGSAGGSAPSIPPHQGGRGARLPFAPRTEPPLESAEGFLFRHSGATGSQNLSLAFNSFFFFIFAIRTEMSRAICGLNHSLNVTFF